MPPLLLQPAMSDHMLVTRHCHQSPLHAIIECYSMTSISSSVRLLSPLNQIHATTTSATRHPRQATSILKSCTSTVLNFNTIPVPDQRYARAITMSDPHHIHIKSESNSSPRHVSTIHVIRVLSTSHPSHGDAIPHLIHVIPTHIHEKNMSCHSHSARKCQVQ